MNNPFYDAYNVLSDVYGEGARLKQALTQRFSDEENRPRTVKTVYGVLENDAYLSLCIRTFAQKSPKAAIRTVLKIALYWLIYLEKPRYTVTDHAVELCKRLGKGGSAPFVNAFLRSFDASAVRIPDGAEGLAVRSSFPLFAVKKLLDEYGERAQAIVAARSCGVSVRFVSGEEEYLSLPHLQTPFPHCYIFPRFRRDGNFSKGNYTFQSVGSIAICGVVEPCDRLLDACAAPGGKSVLLAGKCNQVTACELHPHRVGLIGDYARRMGVSLEIRQADSTVFIPEWEGDFDGVLCDVPCSGLGTAAENPDLLLGKREEDIPSLNRTQLAVLENCARYVKRGGCLYYSTCSVLSEENDGVVGKFLKDHEAFGAEAIASPLACERKAYGLQFLPDTAFGAGFYVSKMRRKGT